MEKRIYIIPEGSRYVIVEASAIDIIVAFEPENTGAFICEVTEDLEYIPSQGDLAIFWGDTNPASAIIAKMKDMQFDESGCKFEAKNGLWYDHAIRFRNPEQYDKILQSHEK